MRPLTAYVPKALCTIANCTLLRWILLQLNSQGFRTATVALPRSAVGMFDKVKAQAPSGFELTPFIAEKPTRGTADTAKQMLRSDASPLLVIYGDSFISADFRSLVESHMRFKRKGALATIVYHRPCDLLEPDHNGCTYHGVMSVERDGRITRFVEKPKINEIKPGFEMANAAAFIVERQLLEDYGDATDFSYHVFQSAAKRENCVYGLDIGKGFRFDVGDISRFYDLNMRVVREELRLPFLDQQVELQARSSVTKAKEGHYTPILVGRDVVLHEGAIVGPDAVIGNGCVVERGARVTRSVIMDNCHISEGSEIDRCIIGPTASIPPNAKLARLVCIARPEDTIALPGSSVATERIHSEVPNRYSS